MFEVSILSKCIWYNNNTNILEANNLLTYAIFGKRQGILQASLLGCLGFISDFTCFNHQFCAA